jgi:hypothetical protein
MVTLHMKADVPESRKVTITLPPEVPTGSVDLTVTVDALTAQPIELAIDPALIPKAFPPRPGDPTLAEEYDAFQRLLPDLLRTHRGQHVAVHQGRIVATGPDRLEVVRQARQMCGNVPLYAALVTDEPQPISRSGLVREGPGGAGS